MGLEEALCTGDLDDLDPPTCSGVSRPCSSSWTGVAGASRTPGSRQSPADADRFRAGGGGPGGPGGWGD